MTANELLSDRRPAARPAPRGFGMLEVLISSAILAVGMAGTTSMVGTLERTYQHQRYVILALHIAEAQIEELLARYATDVDVASGAHTGPSFTSTGKPNGTFFRTSWTVTEGTPIAGTRVITFVTSWTENGVAKSFTLKTIRT